MPFIFFQICFRSLAALTALIIFAAPPAEVSVGLNLTNNGIRNGNAPPSRAGTLIILGMVIFLPTLLLIHVHPLRQI